ncbi:MAG: class I SAM-dependent methyltransferase [Gemmatimonadota bacterium]|nr:MAG: class I SAM-dependent methyltransferase [Gemmatimonadota bacterium]
MRGYYSDTLSAQRLKQVYEIAPPRVQQYLTAEVEHVLQYLTPGDWVLELGCGYGRMIPELSKKTGKIIGIDTSLCSLLLGEEFLSNIQNCYLTCMNAVQLAFPNHVFDMVVCIQNGISAFHVDQKELLRESIRVTKPGGVALFSSYSAKFWEDRLDWFRLQSEAGLVGEIDFEKTVNGEIVCKDGFTATTVGPGKFRLLTEELDADVRIFEVDESSLFCEIMPH